MNFAESPETVPDNVREVQPTAFLAVPRIWEKFYSGITIALKEATWFAELDVPARDRRSGYRIDRRPARGPHALAAAAARLPRRLLAGAPTTSARMIGHRPLPLWPFTGAAPIAPDLIRWYLALGVDMREVYGQTENCGVATVMPADRIKLGTVGKAAP